MAVNPYLFPTKMPIPFQDELFVLARDGVEFQVDIIPGCHESRVKANGTIYLSNMRMVFVASEPVGNFTAFDIPLLNVRGEKYSQTIFFSNSIYGFVKPNIMSDNEHGSIYLTHSFKISFKEGGCGTFAPLFLHLISSVRQFNAQVAQVNLDWKQAAQAPVNEVMRNAYVDPNDPTKIYLQQPNPGSQLRRQNYHYQSAENTM